MRSKMSAIGTSDSAFHDGNPSTGELGTIVTADWLNAVQASTMDLQDELLSVLAAASIANDPAVKTQILAAINKLSKLNMQSGSATFATDTGAANAYVVGLTPALTARSEGQVIRFKVTNANNGACTVNDGVGIVPLVGLALSALQGGEMVTGGFAWMQWHSTVGTGSYVLLFCSGAPLQVADATKPKHAVTLEQLFGGLKGILKFVTSGTFIVPAGVTTLYVSGSGAGGGGGGSGGAAGASSTYAASGGGGGGGAGDFSVRHPVTVTPGQTLTITIGAKGAGGAAGTSSTNGSSGGAGGSTSLIGTGVSVTFSGGAGGGGSALGAGVNAASNGAVGGANGGCRGGQGLAVGNYGYDYGGLGGQGGNSPYGIGGGSNGSSSAVGYGAGGGGGAGSCSLSGAAGAAGGAGAGGLLIIEW